VGAVLVSHDGKGNTEAKEKEADLVVEHIKALQKSDPGASIAILVRSRSHLAQIIPKLKQAELNWQATDIDRLGSLPVIEDLLSLTRALANTSDRLAWFSLLRAPWCGLTSSDLFAVAENVGEQSVWAGLARVHEADYAGLQNLSADGLTRLRPVVEVLHYAMAANRRVALRQLVETTWTLLRGYDLVYSETEIESAAHFFDLLEQFAVGQSIADLIKFAEQVQQSFVTSSKAGTDTNCINILTMHKAKGLEYDHVILPGLTRQPVNDDKPLLQWYERLNGSGENKLFLAALTATGKDEDDLYNLIRSESKAKGLLEDTRLLYIAVTRAKTSALLLGITSDKGDGEHSFSANSLLARIWPQLLEANMLNSVVTVETRASETLSDAKQLSDPTPLWRTEKPLLLTTDEMSAIQRLRIELETPIEQTSFPPEYDNNKAAEIGSLIHRCLEVYSLMESQQDFLQTIDKQEKYWSLLLRDVINDDVELNQTITHIKQVVLNTLNNPDFSWIFARDNSSSQSELQITDVKQKIKVVDRTLIDSEGVRWLIDYKTGSPRQDQSEHDFVSTMIERYSAQLEGYQELFSTMEENPIKMALLLTGINRLAVM
jgi:ATP-dependent exoDNAse (exonuclease V) beta subunit